MAIVTAGSAGFDFDQMSIGDLLSANVASATPTSFVLRAGVTVDEFTGQFTYSADGTASGTVTGWRELESGQVQFEVTGASVSAANIRAWAQSNDNETAKATVLAGADRITGSEAADRMFGYGGDDTLTGAGGQDYLRGGDGNDSIAGGAAFDDVHGNQGDDTVDGGLGGDWVVGGQGNDKLIAGDDAEFNIVYGNLGNDTCLGSAGGDWLRGGQGDDSVSGGAGADLIWGDRGDDTLQGGAGADTFNIFGGANLDRIVDFNAAEGDRLRVEAGFTYTAQQSGADVVVDISGGARAVLVGVTLSSLPSDWIVSG